MQIFEKPDQKPEKPDCRKVIRIHKEYQSDLTLRTDINTLLALQKESIK